MTFSFSSMGASSRDLPLISDVSDSLNPVVVTLDSAEFNQSPYRLNQSISIKTWWWSALIGCERPRRIKGVNQNYPGQLQMPPPMKSLLLRLVCCIKSSCKLLKIIFLQADLDLRCGDGSSVRVIWREKCVMLNNKEII